MPAALSLQRGLHIFVVVVSEQLDIDRQFRVALGSLLFLSHGSGLVRQVLQLRRQRLPFLEQGCALLVQLLQLLLLLRLLLRQLGGGSIGAGSASGMIFFALGSAAFVERQRHRLRRWLNDSLIGGQLILSQIYKAS